MPESDAMSLEVSAGKRCSECARMVDETIYKNQVTRRTAVSPPSGYVECQLAWW